MKHSKFYVGITTAVLTIAGVAATRAHRTITVSSFYATSTPVAAHCYDTKVDRQCTKSGLGARCIFQLLPDVRYLTYTNNTCFTPAKLNVN